MKEIKNKQFDEERALYHSKNTIIDNCIFAGPADGESVLKESRDIVVENCSFSLRYPLWHVNDFVLKNSILDPLTRAALWYCQNGQISDCKFSGIKAENAIILKLNPVISIRMNLAGNQKILAVLILILSVPIFSLTARIFI